MSVVTESLIDLGQGHRSRRRAVRSEPFVGSPRRKRFESSRGEAPPRSGESEVERSWVRVGGEQKNEILGGSNEVVGQIKKTTQAASGAVFY